jgi:hypothetical protein
VEQAELFARGVDRWTLSIAFDWRSGYVVSAAWRLSGEVAWRKEDRAAVSAEGALVAARSMLEDLEKRWGLGEEPF